MPYGLFRTAYSHNPGILFLFAVPEGNPFAYREAYASLLCSYRGGSLSHKSTPVQAHRAFRLLTLASYKFHITGIAYFFLSYTLVFYHIHLNCAKQPYNFFIFLRILHMEIKWKSCIM